VGVQALEAPRTGTRSTDAEVELGPQGALIGVSSLETVAQLGIVDRRASPPLDPARSLEPGDGGNEVGTCKPERRREGVTALVVRELLAHGRPAERAANDNAPKRARGPA